MSQVAEHYENLLAEYYTWMAGDFEARVAEQRSLLERLGLTSSRGGQAVDLGCGPGFQSLALARLGHRVLAIDLSARLLAELEGRRGTLPIETLRADVREVERLAPAGTEVIVCMGDTLTHLETRADVERLLAGAFARLAPGGWLGLSFRDLTTELTGLDRFIPVRSDERTIMTCVLEYEAETVKVHDLVHVREGQGWTLRKSWYRKLRLGPDWVEARLGDVGFGDIHREEARGLVILRARKPVRG